MCQALYLHHLLSFCHVGIVPRSQWWTPGLWIGHPGCWRTHTHTAARWKSLDLNPSVSKQNSPLLSTQWIRSRSKNLNGERAHVLPLFTSILIKKQERRHLSSEGVQATVQQLREKAQDLLKETGRPLNSLVLFLHTLPHHHQSFWNSVPLLPPFYSHTTILIPKINRPSEKPAKTEPKSFILSSFSWGHATGTDLSSPTNKCPYK